METIEITTERCLELLVTNMLFNKNVTYVVIFTSYVKLKEFKKQLLIKYEEVPKYLRVELAENLIKQTLTRTGVRIHLMLQTKNLSNSVKGITAACFFLSTELVKEVMYEFITETRVSKPETGLINFTN